MDYGLLQRYGLWVITGMGYEHRNFLSTKLVDSKFYGFLQVMGYHSMGYLRFDCNQVAGHGLRWSTLQSRLEHLPCPEFESWVL
jgi:hypothetical protein